MKVVIAEPLAPAAVAIFREQPDWDVVVSDAKSYKEHLEDCDALVVRSAVKVDQAVIAKAPKLRVIGRAGVGVDNVDTVAATAAGVLVMNTPGGNAVSVAEHTMAFMLSLARALPQASASTKTGKWEKKKFLGRELRGKTLGIVGLGAIGAEVVMRSRVFGMRVIACDPFVAPQTAANLNASAFAMMKKGVHVVNCARGELIDEAALETALDSGQVGGAGLDVFHPEPPEGSPLLRRDNVLATPHIAGSTEEAQEIVGIRIAQQMVDYLVNGIAVNAVNMPALTPEQFRAVGPWLEVAERLGVFASYIAEGNPKVVRITYIGKAGEAGPHLIRNAGLAGVLKRSLEVRANVVNGMQIAAERGIDVGERYDRRGARFDALRLDLETDQGATSVEGAILLGKPRLMRVEEIPCETALYGNLTYLRNADVPGVIGHIGAVLGRANVNIANFSLGRQESAPTGQPIAVAVVDTDVPLSEALLAELRTHPAVLLARSVNFNG